MKSNQSQPHTRVSHIKFNMTLWSRIIIIILLVVAVLQLSSISKSLDALTPAAIKEASTTGQAIRAAQPAQRSPPQQPQPPSQPQQASTPIDMETAVDDDAVRGKDDAPVTIIEFSDYECSYSKRFYTDTLGQLDEQYIKTGKAKLVFRDFPLSFHKNAQKAAEAAECAKEQGKYYQMHDLLFENGVHGGIASFKEYAKELKLNADKFDECLQSGKMAREVQMDLRDGQALGVRGTPAFLINGQLLSGTQPFSKFKQLIEAELN